MYENYSHNDFKRGLTIPKTLNKDLAEEMGLHLGDGCLGIYRYGHNIKYYYVISGGYDDEAYLKKFVIPLVYRLYHILPVFRKIKDKKYINLAYQSKGLLSFKKSLGLPINKKIGITIPKIILKSDFKLDFIRGLFDTDGCLSFRKRHRNVHYYPGVDISSKSPELIIQISKILKSKGFTISTVLNSISPASNGTLCKISRVYLYGEENLFKWMKLIGTSNPKNSFKFDLWKKYGYLP